MHIEKKKKGAMQYLFNLCVACSIFLILRVAVSSVYTGDSYAGGAAFEYEATPKINVHLLVICMLTVDIVCTVPF